MKIESSFLKRSAAEVSMRPGAQELLRFLIATPNVSPCVISVSWSKEWIAHVLQRLVQAADRIPIFANSLQIGEDGLSTGLLTGGIHGGADKLRVMRAVLERNKASLSSASYVGDSVFDLPSVVSADLGVLVQPDETVGRLCATSGVKLDRCAILPACHPFYSHRL